MSARFRHRLPSPANWPPAIHIIALLAAALLLPAGCRQERDIAGASAILFLRAGPAETAQIFLQPPGDAPARQLTGKSEAAAPVIDYAAAPDGRTIVYSVDLAGDGPPASALRMIGRDGHGDRLLLDCPAAECTAPVWSPDGQRIIYEIRQARDGFPGPPRLYWLDPADGRTLPLIEGDGAPSVGARFSPDGSWLSYVSPGDEGVVVLRLSDNYQQLLTSRAGSPAAISPDNSVVVYSDINLQAYESGPSAGDDGPLALQESANIFLYRSGLGGDAPRQRLSPDVATVDNAAAFSPDGQWLAFGRAPATSHARQLWVMRADGTDARPLTSDPAISHGPPSWSPDGQYLLFQRHQPGDPPDVTSVWMIEVATGQETAITDDGYLPAWLP